MLRRSDFLDDDDFREAQRERKNAYMRRYNHEHRGLKWTVAAGRNIVQRFEPKPETWAERDRVIEAGHRDIVGMVCGDPLRGGSALDQKSGAR